MEQNFFCSFHLPLCLFFSFSLRSSGFICQTSLNYEHLTFSHLPSCFSFTSYLFPRSYSHTFSVFFDSYLCFPSFFFSFLFFSLYQYPSINAIHELTHYPNLYFPSFFYTFFAFRIPYRDIIHLVFYSTYSHLLPIFPLFFLSFPFHF